MIGQQLPTEIEWQGGQVACAARLATTTRRHARTAQLGDPRLVKAMQTAYRPACDRLAAGVRYRSSRSCSPDVPRPALNLATGNGLALRPSGIIGSVLVR